MPPFLAPHRDFDRIDSLHPFHQVDDHQGTLLSPDIYRLIHSQQISTMSKLPNLLASLLHPPWGKVFTEAEQYQYYRNWGFTIYRTAYGTTTDEQWPSLVAKIEAQVLDEINIHGASEPAAPTLRSLFHLDPRSDPDTLDGASMEHVRKLYQEGEASPRDGKRPIMHENELTHRYFLLADAEVLDAVGK
ncbi:hypothetical protein F5883DRAFT_586648 [Diaporthe sp. PMI_573]|nr:hypothetical protein F5883DRAFT_586648 [Diaporthaceae sp. PMI_573]